MAYLDHPKKNRVLVIDLDHQLNLTEFFVDSKDKLLTIEDVFNDYKLIDKAIIPTRYKNISIIPASEYIPLIEHKISSNDHPWDCLQKIIKQSTRIKHEFDYIIIDTHPGIYPFVTCALIASTHFIVPLLAECSFSLDGLIRVENFIESIKETHKCDLNPLGYLVTQFVSKNRLSKEFLSCMKENRPSMLFNSIIRRNTHIPIALANKKSVSQFAPTSIGAIDYKKFVREFKNRLNA